MSTPASSNTERVRANRTVRHRASGRAFRIRGSKRDPIHHPLARDSLVTVHEHKQRGDHHHGNQPPAHHADETALIAMSLARLAKRQLALARDVLENRREFGHHENRDQHHGRRDDHDDHRIDQRPTEPGGSGAWPGLVVMRQHLQGFRDASAGLGDLDHAQKHGPERGGLRLPSASSSVEPRRAAVCTRFQDQSPAPEPASWRLRGSLDARTGNRPRPQDRYRTGDRTARPQAGAHTAEEDPLPQGWDHWRASRSSWKSHIERAAAAGPAAGFFGRAAGDFQVCRACTEPTGLGRNVEASSMSPSGSSRRGEGCRGAARIGRIKTSGGCLGVIDRILLRHFPHPSVALSSRLPSRRSISGDRQLSEHSPQEPGSSPGFPGQNRRLGSQLDFVGPADRCRVGAPRGETQGLL